MITKDDLKDFGITLDGYFQLIIDNHTMGNIKDAKAMIGVLSYRQRCQFFSFCLDYEYHSFFEGSTKQQIMKYIGKGSSRKVYDMGNGTVKKIAYNRWGISQNMTEIDTGRLNPLCPEPIDWSDDYQCITVPKAEKASTKDFKRTFGVGVRKFGKIVRQIACYLQGNANFPDIEDDSPFHEITDLLGTFDLACGDLERPSSWGVIDGNLMCIDSGATKSLIVQFHKSKFNY